jgi:3-oxoacyl-[acyl-carrier protein] reductase
MEIKGKTFLVTGGAQGMGKTFVVELAKLGANVFFCDLQGDKIAQVEEECLSFTSEGQIVKGMEMNIAENSEIVDGQIIEGIDKSSQNFEDFINLAVENTGDIHGIINNAGITRDGLLAKTDRKTGEVKTLSNKKWKQVLDVNLTGVFLGARAYADWHIRNNKKEGVIVSISSVSRHGNRGQSNYSAAKAGIVAMTTLWAGELSRYGIRTGAVAPGATMTPILQSMREDVLENMKKGIPLRRIAETEEIFSAIKFIIECDYFTGRVIDVDGGLRLT